MTDNRMLIEKGQNDKQRSITHYSEDLRLSNMNTIIVQKRKEMNSDTPKSKQFLLH